MNKFFKAGQTVLFQGDSITDCDRDRENAEHLGDGYARRVVEIYELLFPNSGVKFVNRGISGNRVVDLLARYDRDFKAIEPDFISIMIGVNDTWRRYDSNDATSVEQYEKNYAELLTRLRRDFVNIKIMLIEPYLLDSDPTKVIMNEDLSPKILAVRRLAREYADFYLPLGGILAGYQTADFSATELAPDGIHPSPQGHGIIAYEYLKAIGVI